jgi:hypothetical protein
MLCFLHILFVFRLWAFLFRVGQADAHCLPTHPASNVGWAETRLILGKWLIQISALTYAIVIFPLDHDPFHPYAFQFITHNSSYLNSLNYWWHHKINLKPWDRIVAFMLWHQNIRIYVSRGDTLEINLFYVSCWKLYLRYIMLLRKI